MFRGVYFKAVYAAVTANKRVVFHAIAAAAAAAVVKQHCKRRKIKVKVKVNSKKAD
jgi:hypothetical protein